MQFRFEAHSTCDLADFWLGRFPSDSSARWLMSDLKDCDEPNSWRGEAAEFQLDYFIKAPSTLYREPELPRVATLWYLNKAQKQGGACRSYSFNDGK